MAARSSRFSVRARVTAGATLVLAAALFAAAFLANGLLQRSLTDDVDASLENQLAHVYRLVVAGQLTAVHVPHNEDLAQLQVIDDTGQVAAATPGLAPGTRLDVIEAPPPGGEVRATVDGSRFGAKAGDAYRLIAQTFALSPPMTVYAVTPFTTATHALSNLRIGMAIGLPLVLALAAWLIWRVTGRALAPVDEMRAEVDQIQATDLTRRVSPAGPGSEIDRLGATLNHMLERLQDAADRQRLFAASASHELRSPLSAIRTELEVGLAYPERADWPKIAADAVVEVDRLEALARDLRVLTAARSSSARSNEQCDIWAVVTDEIGRRHPERGVRYVTTGTAAFATIDPTSAAQVVRNLFDNAERHAASVITVALADDNGAVNLTVANDGAPIPVDMRERVFAPFTRLDEARSLDSGGSGLGLAIARTVIAAAGGTLVVMDDDVGATFRATLPRRDSRDTAGEGLGAPVGPASDPPWSDRPSV
jgi:signal transduction histidine kinase